MEWFQLFNITNFSICLTKRAIFFQIFWHLFSLFRSFRTRGPENILRSSIISYWQIFNGHGIVVQLFNATNFSNFLIKFAFFQAFLIFFSFQEFFSLKTQEPPLEFDNRLLNNFYFKLNVLQDFNITNFSMFLIFFAILFSNFLTFIVIIQSFWASRVRKPQLGLDYKLMEIYRLSYINFQLFNITSFSNFFCKTCNFFWSFLNFVIFLDFSSIKGHQTSSRVW